MPSLHATPRLSAPPQAASLCDVLTYELILSAGAEASTVGGGPGRQQHLHCYHGQEAARCTHRLQLLHQGEARGGRKTDETVSLLGRNPFAVVNYLCFIFELFSFPIFCSLIKVEGR